MASWVDFGILHDELFQLDSSMQPNQKKTERRKKHKPFIYQNTVYVNYKYASQNSEHHLHLHWPLKLNLKRKTDDIERETRIETRGQSESEKWSANIDLIFNVMKASFIEKPWMQNTISVASTVCTHEFYFNYMILLNGIIWCKSKMHSNCALPAEWSATNKISILKETLYFNGIRLMFNRIFHAIWIQSAVWIDGNMSMCKNMMKANEIPFIRYIYLFESFPQQPKHTYVYI